jgi:RsmE family RNA methyltransferase
MNCILIEQTENEGFFPSKDHRAIHLKKILKAVAGDQFKAGVIDAGTGTLTVTEILESGIRYEYRASSDKTGLFPLTVLMAYPRPPMAKRIVRDGTALGIGQFVFFVSELTEKTYKDSHFWTKGQFREALIEGAGQAGDSFLPEVRHCRSLEQAIESLSSRGDRICLDHRGDKCLAEKKSAQDGSAVFAIGPERGWTEKELEKFHGAGFESRTLGKRILRVDTAFFASTSCLLADHFWHNRNNVT